MEIRLRIAITLEVPDSERHNISTFLERIFDMIRGKLFTIFAVRNVVVIPEK